MRSSRTDESPEKRRNKDWEKESGESRESRESREWRVESRE